MNKILILILAIASTACSNQAIYETIQASDRHTCYTYVGSRFESCLQRYDKTYEEYKRERDEVILSTAHQN